MTVFPDIALWILITLYWITGLCNFYAARPQREPDDEQFFKAGKTSYAFRIITSLIFFYYGISQFKQDVLVYLTFFEIAVIITAYTCLIILEHKHSKRYKSQIPTKK